MYAPKTRIKTRRPLSEIRPEAHNNKVQLEITGFIHSKNNMMETKRREGERDENDNW